jgi:4-amino-4-deoxy-L-arabinose transferase-like glycosyltransferase
MSADRSLTRRDWLVLLVVGLGLFFAGLTSLPPIDRDESRYAVTSQRMADTGDIVDLRFQEQPRYLQPAGIYWLQAASAALLDSPAHDSIWAYRIPSLFGALLAMLATGWLGARYFGRNAGLAAALLLGACYSLNFEARVAKVDAALLAIIVISQLALMRAYIEPEVGRGNAALFWASLGAGLMLKGPVALLFSGGTVLALLVWDRNGAWLARLRPLWGPLLTLAIATPWFIAIGIITDGEFYTRSLLRNFLGKVGAGEQGHDGPFGYHAALFLLAFWPGSLLALRSVGFVWRNRAEPAMRFLVCWIAPGWLAFELVATKLPHYVLPAYPAIALLAGAALFDPKPAPANRTGDIVFVLVAALWLVAAALVAGAAPAALSWTQQIVSPLAIASAVFGFAAAAASLWLLRRQRRLEAVGAMTLAAALIWANTFGHVMPRLESFWLSPRIDAAARAARPCPDSVLVTTPYSEPSLVFLYGRERTRITPSADAAAEALAETAQCGLALIGAEERTAFLDRAAALGLDPQPVDRVSGRNYSNGDDVDLTLYLARPLNPTDRADASR